MSGLVEHLDAVTNASTVEELWALHVDKMGSYGFDRLIYGFTRFRSATSLGDPQDWVVLTNHGPAFIKGFLTDGLVYNSPMIRWALENDGACSWRWMEQMAKAGKLTQPELEVLEFNRRQDVTSGYTISFRSVSTRTKGAIALTGHDGLSQDAEERIWSRHGAEITLINNVAHLKILTLPHMTARQLTKRQREVLEWVGDGKTTQDIAVIMGLTQATVEKHLRLARQSLDVETTAQAVLKAAFYNQMFVMEG